MKTIEDYIMDGGGNEFFPNQNDKILIDEVGKYSISKPYAVEKITEIIKRNIFSFDKVITDAFSCIGGDTLGFSKLFKHVNANELDKTRFEYLKHNMKIFNRTNITFYNEDYLIHFYSNLLNLQILSQFFPYFLFHLSFSHL